MPCTCCQPWANQVHVHMGEPLLWDANLLHWCAGLGGDFGTLARHKLSASVAKPGHMNMLLISLVVARVPR